MTDWDKMPVAQKSSLIRMFVENGITDVGEMRHIYAEGGVMDESDTQGVIQEPQQDTLPGDYDQWMNSMALKLSEMSNNSYIFTLCDIADNRDFDYSGMYNDNPQYAWSLLDDGNPDFYELGKMIYGEPEPVMEEIGQISDTEGDITQNEYADGGELGHPVPPEYNDMARVLMERYKNLNFVQRALNPDDYPYIENENGDRVTHLMEVSDDGAGNYFIYPTVVQKYAGSGLEVLDSDDAFSHAMRTGEYITVPNKDFAVWYSTNGLIDHLHDSEGNEYAEGGRIHIKKENRGKFTEAAKRAGKSVQEYARQILANKGNYSPTLVKRANFARNASKWHDDGGFLNNVFADGGGFRKFKKEEERIAQQYGWTGTSGNIRRKQFRQNREGAWDALQNTGQIYQNLMQAPLYQPAEEQRIESYNEQNNIPLDYNYNPFNTSIHNIRQSAYDMAMYDYNQLSPTQKFVNSMQSGPLYEGAGNLALELALFPTWFIGGAELGSAAKALTGKTSTGAIRAAELSRGAARQNLFLDKLSNLKNKTKHAIRSLNRPYSREYNTYYFDKLKQRVPEMVNNSHPKTLYPDIEEKLFDVKDAVQAYKNEILLNDKQLGFKYIANKVGEFGGDVLAPEFLKMQDKIYELERISPEYIQFLIENPSLEPTAQSTLDAFFARQSKSVRGIHAPKDIEWFDDLGLITKSDGNNTARRYLTIPPESGPDRLRNSGLYTSNSFEIADRFMRPEYDPFLNRRSYIGELQYDFNIDKTKSIEDQLRQYRKQIDNWHDIEIPIEDRYKGFNLAKNNIRVVDRGAKMKEAEYVRSTGERSKSVYERSINPKYKGEYKAEPVVSISKLHDYGVGNENLKGRWGLFGMESDPTLFIPKQLSKDYPEFVRFVRNAKTQSIKSVDNPIRQKAETEAIKLIENQNKKYNMLQEKALDRLGEISRKLQLSLIGGSIGTGGAVFTGKAIKSHEKIQSESEYLNEHIKELLDAVKYRYGENYTDEQFDAVFKHEYERYKKFMES